MKMKPEGNYEMRFICDENGKLLKGAPGNYTCGKTYMMPLRHSEYPYWELLGEPPVLEIPPPSEDDDVFSGVSPLPDIEVEQDDSDRENVEDFDAENVDADAPAVLEPYASIKNGKVVAYQEETRIPEVSDSNEAEEEETDEELDEFPSDEEWSRDELKRILDEEGVEYSKYAHTPTLKEKVEELGSEEES